MPPAEKRDWKLNNDRRSHRRYSVSVDAEYRLASRGRPAQIGRGRTVNLSSGGMLFEAEDQLPTNTRIELTIPWPTRINDNTRLDLHVTGETVRVEGNNVAVRIGHLIFRTSEISNGGKRDGH